MGTVTLKTGHVQPLWAGHPWVFAQAIQKVEGGLAPGDEVDVVDPRGNFLGRGLYSPKSALVVRIFSRTPGENLDGELLGRRVAAAVARRSNFGLPSEQTNGYRLINGEGDGLPGLIVDRFGRDLVVQFGSIGMKLRQPLVVATLRQAMNPRAIIDRSSARAGELEGFTVEHGAIFGEAPDTFQFEERGLSYRIALKLGQKTGYYFDQRPLRDRIEALARGKRVLDTYTYVGSIALGAARGGAKEVHAVDSSAVALQAAAECAEASGLAGRVSFERRDSLEALQSAGRKGGYDLVVCDPPKLAPSRGAQRRALASMRRIAAAASRATRPGGLLALCSCSAAIGVEDLTRALAVGARDVGVEATVFERCFQGPDHPVPAAFREGLYLSCVLAEIRPIGN